ncbi:HAD family hydrolase [Ornithinimicrobium faecis]|uniref:HAD family hydrolase n=1 Tax=Ornithinimicrobium faecis TaxID=2934158 RepID=UPI002118533B|nr:HAD family hydrolase [Ornithinimicrobium sp. HY1745]
MTRWSPAVADQDSSAVLEPEPISAVLFDFHNTLVHGGDATAWLATGWTAAGRHDTPTDGLGAEPAAAAAAFLDRVWEHAHEIDPDSSRDESPQQHRRVFLATVERCPGIDADLAEALYAVMPLRWEAYADTVPVLTALRERGVRTAIVSNIGFDLRPIIERSNIVVDAVVLSYEVHSVKPAAGIFQHALDLLGASAQETLMVGDSWRDDSGAAALGIRTLLLPRTDGPHHGLASVLRLVSG